MVLLHGTTTAEESNHEDDHADDDQDSWSGEDFMWHELKVSLVAGFNDSASDEDDEAGELFGLARNNELAGKGEHEWMKCTHSEQEVEHEDEVFDALHPALHFRSLIRTLISFKTRGRQTLSFSLRFTLSQLISWKKSASAVNLAI